ncbi:MAG: hypothetical protein KBE23_17055 [Chloroflexi bacterium]|nr:hypothetical protein [Chloroflexota bacterium]MBP7044463.1 hypothetical protein [Chloroflexota bacterium]
MGFNPPSHPSSWERRLPGCLPHTSDGRRPILPSSGGPLGTTWGKRPFSAVYADPFPILQWAAPPDQT